MYAVFDKAFWSEDEVKNLTPKEIRKVVDEDGMNSQTSAIYSTKEFEEYKAQGSFENCIIIKI